MAKAGKFVVVLALVPGITGVPVHLTIGNAFSASTFSANYFVAGTYSIGVYMPFQGIGSIPTHHNRAEHLRITHPYRVYHES